MFISLMLCSLGVCIWGGTYTLLTGFFQNTALLIAIFLVCITVLGSILYIRKTIQEMPYVPPYQGFTLVFFINLLLFFFVYLAFLLYSRAYW